MPILLPPNLSYVVHKEACESHSPMIIACLTGSISHQIIGDILPRNARLVHQKVMFDLAANSLALEIVLPESEGLSIANNTFDTEQFFGVFCRSKWTHIHTLFPLPHLEHTDLYRSDEEIIEYDGKRWKIKFWFCGPYVDCGIHNEHDFTEWHVGIAGDGLMQKFSEDNENSLIESWRMSPGQTHPVFALKGITNKEGYPVYPYHRWFGGNRGDLWLVVEEYF